MNKKTPKRSKKLMLTSERVREMNPQSLSDDKLRQVAGGHPCTDSSDNSISH